MLPFTGSAWGCHCRVRKLLFSLYFSFIPCPRPRREPHRQAGAASGAMTCETFQFLGFGAARGAPSVGSGLSRIPQACVACLLYPGPFGLHSPFVARRLCGIVSCPTHVCSRCLLCVCGSLARLIPFEAAGGDVTLACESPCCGREAPFVPRIYARVPG